MPGESSGPTTTLAFHLFIAVLGFGTLLLGLSFFLVFKRRWGPEWALKIIGIPLVVTTAMALIVGGWDEHQIAGAMGLLGTIAGYLLAKGVRAEAKIGKAPRAAE